MVKHVHIHINWTRQTWDIPSCEFSLSPSPTLTVTAVCVVYPLPRQNKAQTPPSSSTGQRRLAPSADQWPLPRTSSLLRLWVLLVRSHGLPALSHVLVRYRPRQKSLSPRSVSCASQIMAETEVMVSPLCPVCLSDTRWDRSHGLSALSRVLVRYRLR